jgi:alpha-D-xyloside xylohydrolase
MPYIYSAAVLSARTGVPMLRALLVDSPDDPAAWTAELEYRLGPDLLVAPMTDPRGSRHVYLPHGAWADFWTGEVHPGGRHIRVDAPLARVPLFVRHGALVPTTPPSDQVGAGPFPELTVVSWGGNSGRTVIRDVDGDTAVVAVRDGVELRVQTEGPARVRRVALARTAGAVPPTRVLLNGTAVELSDPDA